MSSANLSVVAGDQPGSRTSITIPITPTEADGWTFVFAMRTTMRVHSNETHSTISSSCGFG